MISRRLSKLMRFIVNNLMPNLESPLVPLWRAPKLLEVHLPQFGNSGRYNMLFSVAGVKNSQKIQGPNLRFLHTFFASKQLKSKGWFMLLTIELENLPIFGHYFSQNFKNSHVKWLPDELLHVCSIHRRYRFKNSHYVRQTMV